MADPSRDAAQVADAVAVRVLEGARIDLVHHRPVPLVWKPGVRPQSFGLALSAHGWFDTPSTEQRST